MANALKKENIRVILFDADKTLYDIHTEKAYEQVYSLLSQELGPSIKQLQQEHREEVLKIKDSLDPTKRDHRYTLEHLIKNHTKSYKVLTDKAYSLFWDQILKDLGKKKETLEILNTLSKQYILAIATDEFYPLVERKLNKVLGNWKEYFHVIISSDKVGTMKPSTKYYTEAMDLFQVKAEHIVMIGDSWKRDLAPAKELGIFTILINKKEGSPDLVLENIGQLKKIF
jgi:putative hydrolase of the HAD superfamily